MKVAFIAYDSTPSTGGVGRVTHVLSDGFNNRGIKCFLIYNVSTSFPATNYEAKFKYDVDVNEDELLTFLKDNKIDIIVEQGVVNLNIKKIRAIANSCGCSIVSIVHAKPDLIRVFPSIRSLIWELRRIKNPVLKFSIISKIATFPIYKAISNWKYIRWRRSLYDNADRVVVLSKYYIKNYVELLKLEDNSKVTAIPNPIRFPESIAKQELINKKNEVLIVSRLVEVEKYLSRIFDVWGKIEEDEQLKEWKLVIVGAGRDEQLYRKIVRLKKLKNVTFEGVRETEEYFRRAKVFLMSSAHEGFPMTLLEAIQMGVPIVAFNNFESLAELVIDNYNGFIVSKDDISHFVNRLKELMKYDTLRIQFANNAIEHSQNFSVERVIDRWIDLFNSVLNESKLNR